MEIVCFIPLLGFLSFISCILFLSQRNRRKELIVSKRKKEAKTIVSSVLLVLFFILFFAELLFQSLKIQHSFLPELFAHKIHHSDVLSTFGAVLVICSILLVIYTLKSFKTSLRFGLDSENRGELVTTGIFTYSRNPFFVSILLHFTGIAFVFPSVFFAGITVFSYVSIHFFILKEEKFMHDNYGEEYDEYCSIARRYF